LTHPGRQQKHCWLKANFKIGLRAKAVLAPDGHPCGYIEYLPGEFAWRGVDASGYMFVHCVWTYSKKHQRKGCGSAMVEACLSDARKAGMSGVALASALAATRPDLPVIYASGYAEEAILRAALDDDHVPYLPKPFTSEALLTRVREVLDRRTTPG
ncbi:MAG: GNAT family N-acetyltransferase, partial [Bryobacteraceae bacterium]